MPLRVGSGATLPVDEELRQDAYGAFEPRHAFAQVGNVAPETAHVTVHDPLAMQDESGENDGRTDDGDEFGRKSARFGSDVLCLRRQGRGAPRGASMVFPIPGRMRRGQCSDGIRLGREAFVQSDELAGSLDHVPTALGMSIRPEVTSNWSYSGLYTGGNPYPAGSRAQGPVGRRCERSVALCSLSRLLRHGPKSRGPGPVQAPLRRRGRQKSHLVLILSAYFVGVEAKR